MIFFDSLVLKVKKIFEKLSRVADIDARLLPSVYALGAIFSLTVVIMYGIGVGFAWALGLVFSLVNKLILNARNNLLYRINDTFRMLEVSSLALQDTSEYLVLSLSDAQKNEWRDNLIGKITDGIVKVNSSAEKSVRDTLLLRRLLEQSQYREIFNFPLFEGWIRTQVITPIDEIIVLLKQNHDILERALLSSESVGQSLAESS